MYGPYGPYHYRDVVIRPARTEPLAPRAARLHGGFTDAALEHMLSDKSIPEAVKDKLRLEQAERKLDPK